jgi:hypothetical protein
VDDYHQNQSQPFQGLVQPSDSERLLNGYKLRTARKIDRLHGKIAPKNQE